MDRAALIDAGGRYQHAVLADCPPAKSDVPFAGFDLADIADRAGGRGAGDETTHFIAARRGRLPFIRAETTPQDEVVASDKRGLAARRGDRSGIGDRGAHQQHEPAARRHRFGGMGGDLRAGLDRHRAARPGKDRHIAGARQTRINAAIEELIIGDIGGRRDQIAGIDLRRATENDPIPVDDVNRSVGLDGPEDLGRISPGTDAVERYPVGIALLIEHEIGLAPDIEAVPGEDRLAFGLADRDHGAAISARRLCRAVGADPQAGIPRDTACDLQPALAEAVGNG